MNKDLQPEDDRQLIKDAQRRPADFAALYMKYQRAVFKFFWYRLHDTEISLDFVQETFLRAFVQLKKFRHRGYSYFSYLRRIANNLLIDYFRKKSTVPLTAAENLPDDRAEESIIQLEVEAMWQVIHRLPDADRAILILFYGDQLSLKEIAQRQGRSQNAVKLQLSRARRRLRQAAKSPFPSR